MTRPLIVLALAALAGCESDPVREVQKLFEPTKAQQTLSAASSSTRTAVRAVAEDPAERDPAGAARARLRQRPQAPGLHLLHLQPRAPVPRGVQEGARHRPRHGPRARGGGPPRVGARLPIGQGRPLGAPPARHGGKQARPLRDPVRAGARRDGRGLQGDRHRARAHRRGQDRQHGPGARRRREVRGALLPGGARRRQPQPPEHRHGVRRRQGRQRRLHGDGVHRGRGAALASRRGAPCRCRRRCRSPRRSPRASPTRTSTASCTATSSPPTSWCSPTGR